MGTSSNAPGEYPQFSSNAVPFLLLLGPGEVTLSIWTTSWPAGPRVFPGSPRRRRLQHWLLRHPILTAVIEAVFMSAGMALLGVVALLGHLGLAALITAAFFMVLLVVLLRFNRREFPAYLQKVRQAEEEAGLAASGDGG